MTYRKSVYIWLTITVLLIVTMFTAVGLSYARYRVVSSKTLNMSNNYSSNGVWLMASYNENYDMTGADEESQRKYNELQNWTAVDNSTYTLNFLISNENNEKNPAAFNQNVGLEIFASEGIADASNLTITLSSGDGVYTAEAEATIEGSPVYNAYGAGWVYKFNNDNGQPITWFLKGDQASAVPLTLTVAGEGAEPASLSLIAVGTPAD